MRPAIVWFRNDLRLADNPALHAAARSRRPLVCIYIHDEETPGLRSAGAAARWWLHGSLEALHAALAKHGGHLNILRGASGETLNAIVDHVNAEAIYWNRRYDAGGRQIDDDLETELEQRGIEVETFNGHLLHEPWILKNQSGKPFRVFTAYWRTALKQAAPPAPLPAPRKLLFHRPLDMRRSLNVQLAALGLRPAAPDWAGGIHAAWRPDETGAHAHLKRFLARTLSNYATDRDRPDLQGTSRLSPYLTFGNISPRQVWHTAQKAVPARDVTAPRWGRHRYRGSSAAAPVSSRRSAALPRQLHKFLAELGWREFNYHVLYHHPDLAARNFQSRFDPLRWRRDRRGLEAWRRGRTGYPIVDAGMRELWTTGWMHNRVRMVAASFLIKHLLIDWRSGERWFWDTLVDADPANNPANWQWVAGTGADAAPYFRIFNPVLQGEKFDPDGDYVRRWVPELAHLPAKLIHKPWTAGAKQLAAAGVRLGETYPHPIVDHHKARLRALRNIKSLG
jgi:deoxyribodipyrimidine photo-lyase